ncbi:MAG TPA: hypothetical protein PKM23_08620 [bacterium]|nr:hypothetical protein [bacterium]
MVSLRFDFRDLFRAPRLAFSLQRMWILLVGIAAGWLTYFLLTFLALLLAGPAPGEIWSRFGLLPALSASRYSFPWYSWLLQGLAAAAAFCALLIAQTAHARALYMSCKGEHFYSWRKAYAFAWRKLGAVIMTPTVLGLLMLLFIGGAWLAGLAGRIPWAGELGIALLAVIWFVLALLMIFFGMVLLVALLYAPAVIAATDEDAFESIFQLFSLVWNQPWRLLIYELLSVLLALFALGVLAFFCKRAVGLTNSLFSYFMGGNYADLANNGQALVQAWTAAGEGMLFWLFRGFTPLLYFTQEFYYLPVQELARPTVAVSGYLYAFSLLFLAGWVFSYGLSTLNAAHLLSYLSMRKHKDEVNLLERRDREEEYEEELESEADGKEPPPAQNQ